MSTPSEKYADFRRGQQHPVFAGFAGLYEFPLDDFQVRACHEVEEGRGVLVAAPTGSGKTVVGEFAVHLALETGRKCFYTTPIKALSNQKYHDLVERYGADQVGLLTGDNTINGEAPVVVMTTEVLRNMLYAGSRTLTGLGFVVMDEVHYLADRMRGAVWEEVIIHLPESVAVISLSATVSNAEEFGEWLETVRGDTTTIVEELRPVPLFQHVMVGKRLHDLFDDEEDLARPASPRRAPRSTRSCSRWPATTGRPPGSATAVDKKGQRGRGQRPQGRASLPAEPLRRRPRLDAEGLLPAIVFIFSRVGCDAAVTQCVGANLRLTTPAERDEIYAFVEEHCRHLPEDDLHVLGYHEFLDGLTRGIAAHHAGMLPTFKECALGPGHGGRLREALERRAGRGEHAERPGSRRRDGLVERGLDVHEPGVRQSRAPQRQRARRHLLQRHDVGADRRDGRGLLGLAANAARDVPGDHPHRPIMHEPAGADSARAAGRGGRIVAACVRPWGGCASGCPSCCCRARSGGPRQQSGGPRRRSRRSAIRRSASPSAGARGSRPSGGAGRGRTATGAELRILT